MTLQNEGRRTTHNSGIAIGGGSFHAGSLAVNVRAEQNICGILPAHRQAETAEK